MAVMRFNLVGILTGISSVQAKPDERSGVKRFWLAC